MLKVLGQYKINKFDKYILKCFVNYLKQDILNNKEKVKVIGYEEICGSPNIAYNTILPHRDAW